MNISKNDGTSAQWAMETWLLGDGVWMSNGNYNAVNASIFTASISLAREESSTSCNASVSVAQFTVWLLPPSLWSTLVSSLIQAADLCLHVFRVAAPGVIQERDTKLDMLILVQFSWGMLITLCLPWNVNSSSELIDLQRNTLQEHTIQDIVQEYHCRAWLTPLALYLQGRR